jgi:hypothetical protein
VWSERRAAADIARDVGSAGKAEFWYCVQYSGARLLLVRFQVPQGRREEQAMILGTLIFGAGFVCGVIVTGIAALAFMLWALFSDMEYEP